MSAPIVLTGRLVADPEIKFGGTGTAILKARVVTSGRKKSESGWEDVDTTFWSVTAFRQLAENVCESLSKGDEVIVVGKVKSREYETADGEKRTLTEVVADAFGPNLRLAAAKITRINRASAGTGGDSGAAAYAKAKEDIWSTPNEEMPF